jgi:hypothetical protein
MHGVSKKLYLLKQLHSVIYVNCSPKRSRIVEAAVGLALGWPAAILRKQAQQYSLALFVKEKTNTCWDLLFCYGILSGCHYVCYVMYL